MTMISLAGSRMLDRIGASRAGPISPPRVDEATRRQGAAVVLPMAGAVVSGANGASTYADPRSSSAASRGIGHVWASPALANDAISIRMAANRAGSIYSLGDQWRGLGGALLKRFGETGENYAQTRVDDSTAPDELAGLAPELRAQRAADIVAAQSAALASVADNGAVATFNVRLRSGLSVELGITVSQGFDGLVGTQVSLESSGAMSANDRKAVQKLAEGLDRALEGLGQDDVASIDLSGLADYDRTAIDSLDLTVDTHRTHETQRPLESFALHLGGDRSSVTLEGAEGEMHLSVGMQAPPVQTMASQRQASLRVVLDRIAAAGQRGQANAALVEQMKSAFMQLQTAAAAHVPAQSSAQVAGDAAASGLADFDAGFGGPTWRLNAAGTARLGGQVSYRLNQQTVVTNQSQGGQSTRQTLSEELSADYRESLDGGTLDVDTGNYSSTRVRDASTVTTLIDSAAGRVKRAQRMVQEQQLKTVAELRHHQVTSERSWPAQRRVLERLA